MRTEAPAGGQRRPPKSAVLEVGASVRPTARTRPTVPARVGERLGVFEPSDPYVRRFWVAAIGAGAVAELLRLIRSAAKGEEVRLPRHLPHLLRAGLVWSGEGCLLVSDRLPVVPPELRWRFPPALAADHNRVIATGVDSASDG